MANPTNKSYDGIITWATGSSNDIQAKNLITARNIKLTNSSNTQLAAASFNGTADATLKLAATVPISISGNADTATSATTATKGETVQVNGINSINSYPIALTSSSVIYSSNYYALQRAVNTTTGSSGLSCIPGAAVAANTEGTTTLVIGNILAKSVAENRTGNIRLYGNNTGYTTINPGYNSTGAITLTLPSSTGTLALTSQIPTSGVVDTFTDSSGGFVIKGVKFSSGLKIISITNVSSSYTSTYTFRETFQYAHAYCYGAAPDDTKAEGFATFSTRGFGSRIVGRTNVGHSWFETQSVLSTTKIVLNSYFSNGGVVFGY